MPETTFVSFEKREDAARVAGLLSEETGRPWRATLWNDNSWAVTKDTLESEINWLPAGAGDVSDWLRAGMETWFEHTYDFDAIADWEPGADAADWREAKLYAQGVATTPVGDVATVFLVVGKGETTRRFEIKIRDYGKTAG